MALSQTKSYFQWTKIALANVGVLLVLSPSIFLPLPSLAQSVPQAPRITCSDSDSFLIKAYTDNYDVHICGNGDINGKYSMIVQSVKSGSVGITLAARPVDKSLNVFEAKADNTTYTLNINNKELRILQIVQTPVKPSPGKPKPKPIRSRNFVETVEKINALMMS
ncbi:hypothetical protein [Brunnivagina elsteri]|uniref:Uncharacterized protein n=1 Tax=Brunnivagina elsteri CCALA 953 TaxID=987040 RepID=A0A2A2TM06_9CYAN|nr:hypothetical protein [Calothrix elsteri]PAX59427.1 hypothetical protein CK510_06985 [Calothrix elsteri CCALA 953]